jgi:EAL domain-containing protein (putative c-di-GMP-specific phosphodiesterase class I)
VILKETGAPADCIDIEVPESTAMKNVERSAQLMRELAGMGVHISIDDFGTGYSSLNYLKRMPIEKLKIDQSFIVDITRDHDDRAIIRAVTAMAHSMKIKVIAEGVESSEQLSFLRGISCDEAQGYLFSKPVTADEFREMVEAGG